jgi:hypothetical protein
VSKGLKFYRTCPQLDEEIRLQFQNSQPLEEIVQLLNDTFDSMNARCPRDGVKMDNWPMKKEFFFKVFLPLFVASNNSRAVYTQQQNLLKLQNEQNVEELHEGYSPNKYQGIDRT